MTSHHERPRYVPISTYRLQVHGGFPLTAARDVAGYLARLGVGGGLHLAVLRRGAGQHARLRRLQPQRDQPGAGRRRRAMRGSPTRSQAHGLQPHRRLRAESHGHRHRHQRVVERRARERSELTLGEVLRHRLGAGQGGAARQAAAADPRRSVRPGARARRAAADVPGRRAGAALLRPRAAGQPAPGAARVSRRAVDRWTETLGRDDPQLHEFLSIITSLENLPPYTDTDAAAHGGAAAREGGRARPAGAAGERGADQSASASRRQSGAFNGEPGRPESFDALHELLESQAYRLSYWRTASHEINYRRFFDINTLAGLRVEDAEVFEQTHRLLGQLIADGKVQGVRIDHPDGLFDPRALLLDAAGSRGAFVGDRARGRPGRPAGPAAASPGGEDPLRPRSGCRGAGPCTAPPATTS